MYAYKLRKKEKTTCHALMNAVLFYVIKEKLKRENWEIFRKVYRIFF